MTVKDLSGIQEPFTLIKNVICALKDNLAIIKHISGMEANSPECYLTKVFFPRYNYQFQYMQICESLRGYSRHVAQQTCPIQINQMAPHMVFSDTCSTRVLEVYKYMC